jgi:lysozyme
MSPDKAPPPPGIGGRFGKAGAFAALVSLVGLGAAAIIVPETQRWEGREYVAYRDVAGILTICDGDTQDVRQGQRADDVECDTRLARQLVAHAKPVLRCVPDLGKDERRQQLAASVILAYNIGPTGFCGSTVARRFNAGDWRGGCEAFLPWNKSTVSAAEAGRLKARGESCTRRADGRWLCTIKGLSNRRAAERKICLTGAL